ncbi:MAG: heat-inducible transcriptional repressor HrcA [Actinomycetota bacterium]
MRRVEITDRQRQILFKTLELHISTGAPVGSHTLAEFVDASSSTIRAELAYLESIGLLTHPHTSAGRVPTDAGYRLYVDSLLSEEGDEEEVSFETMEGYANVDELLRGVSEGMSELTHLLAVVAGPSAIGDSLSRVDYLPLPNGSLLLVVSMQSGASSSMTVNLPARVRDDELREMFDALNAWVGDRPLGGDLELSAAARKALSGHDPLVVGTVLRAVESLGRTTESGVFVRGASALLARLDELDPQSLAAVVEIFERRRWLLRLVSDALQRSVSRSGVVVSIGAENALYNLVGTSLVAAAYSQGERPYGVVGLIGPKRMDYDVAIVTVRSAAETLTNRLTVGF